MATIRKRGERWKAEVCKHGIRKSKTFRVKVAAEKWARDLEDEIEAGRFSTGNKTFADLLERYEENVSRTKKSFKFERTKIGVFLKDPISKVRLSEFRAPDVADWRDRRLTKVSAASVLREWSILSAACNYAVKEWHWLKHNPFSDVKRPAEPPPRSRRITTDEITRLTHVLSHGGAISERVGAAFLFAIETAMRCGEICAITPEHVDLKRRFVHVPTSKNGKARDVPLSSEAIRILEGVGCDFDLETSQVDSLFRKAKKKALIGDLHFHDTRREATTRLAKIFDVMELARITGHTDLRILQAVYYAPKVDDLVSKLD